MSVADFRNQLAEPINRVIYQGERVVLERRGKDVAAVVSMDDLRRLEAMEDASDVKAASKARKEKGAVPLEKIIADLGLSARQSKGGKRARRAVKTKARRDH